MMNLGGVKVENLTLTLKDFEDFEEEMVVAYGEHIGTTLIAAKVFKSKAMMYAYLKAAKNEGLLNACAIYMKPYEETDPIKDPEQIIDGRVRVIYDINALTESKGA